jgi:hypothetical protein
LRGQREIDPNDGLLPFVRFSVQLAMMCPFFV